MGMTSSRPYLIRALYEWIIDNELTPYLLVNAKVSGTSVPSQHIQEGKIVLNLSPQAVADLQLGNDLIEFRARFSGVETVVSIPIPATMAIYAKESGQGMVFAEEGGDGPPDPDPDKPPERPNLKVVK